MYYSVEQFLDRHFAAISAIIEQAAIEAGGHYAALSPAARRLNAEHDAVAFIQALSEGRADRQAARINGSRPSTTGLLADDLLQLSRHAEPLFEAFINQELAAHPALREELIRRARQVHASFRASLTGVKIDQVLDHLTQHRRSA